MSKNIAWIAHVQKSVILKNNIKNIITHDSHKEIVMWFKEGFGTSSAHQSAHLLRSCEYLESQMRRSQDYTKVTLVKGCSKFSSTAFLQFV